MAGLPVVVKNESEARLDTGRKLLSEVAIGNPLALSVLPSAFNLRSLKLQQSEGPQDAPAYQARSTCLAESLKTSCMKLQLALMP